MGGGSDLNRSAFSCFTFQKLCVIILKALSRIMVDKLQFIVGMRSRTFLGRKVLELSKELPEKGDKDPVLFPEPVWTESGVLRLS